MSTANRAILAGAILIILVLLLFGGIRHKELASPPTRSSIMELAIYEACTAARKMDMMPTAEAKSEADHAIARLELIAQTHVDRDMAINATFILHSYQEAIEAFKKDPNEKNLAALQKLQADVNEIRETAHPQ